jgi:FkbM family methyltransferase
MAKKFAGLTVTKSSFNNESWTTVRNDTDLDDVLNEWVELDAVVAPMVKARFVAVHAGGYRGVFARRLSEQYALVYTFEPDPINFHCLVNNNQVDNVIKLQSALSNDHALVNVNNPTVTADGVEYVANGDYPSLRIDDLNLQSCNLMIIDVGGYEYQALLGATQTVKKFLPVVAVKDVNDNIVSFIAGQYGYVQKAEVAGYTIFVRE